MPINANQVQFFKARVNDDTPENGGLISTDLIADGVKNNIFPDASKNERLNGSTKYRKVFLGLRNPDNTPAIEVKLFVLRPTQANDAVVMVEADYNNTQDDIDEFDRRWGAGQLVSAVNVGDTSITVTPEQAIYQVFQVDDTIAITIRSDAEPNAPVDFYKIVAVTDSGSNKVLTINRGLDNAMPAGAVVSSCVFLDQLATQLYDYQFELSGGGSVFNFNQVYANNAGAINDAWVLVFTSTTQFTLYSESGGQASPVANGNISSDFSPLNPVNNQPYFTIPASAFSGAFQAGDMCGFRTLAPNHPIFLERIIPAGTDYAAGNSVILAVELESA